MPLQLHMDIVTPEGQPLIPVFATKPWFEQKKNEVLREIKPAQHLLDGGLFSYKGDLEFLASDYAVNEELQKVWSKMFTPDFM